MGCPGDSVPLRSTPAPPTIYCVICSANNLYLAGPSPYACPGVDKPPDTPYRACVNERDPKPRCMYPFLKQKEDDQWSSSSWKA